MLPASSIFPAIKSTTASFDGRLGFIGAPTFILFIFAISFVATGKLAHFTRDEINSKIIELGAKAGSSVTKKTDYLICGEKAGSKLTKAQALGIKILSEDEFLEMIA